MWCVYVCGNGWETNTHTRSDYRSDNKRVLEQESLALVSSLQFLQGHAQGAYNISVWDKK